MKKQGKSWSKAGAEAMLGLIEARMNETLLESFETLLKQGTTLNEELVPGAAVQANINLRPYSVKAPSKPHVEFIMDKSH